VKPDQTAIVWALTPEKTLRPIKVRVGITDLTVSELVEGDIKEGEQLIIGSSSTRSAPGANPLGRAAGGGGGGRRP
jgi:HlyD family secretion protein